MTRRFPFGGLGAGGALLIVVLSACSDSPSNDTVIAADVFVGADGQFVDAHPLQPGGKLFATKGRACLEK